MPIMDGLDFARAYREYFEEPVMYDHFEEIKEVADALTLPVANGEQDQSFVHFRWSIANDGLDIVQPDNY